MNKRQGTNRLHNFLFLALLLGVASAAPWKVDEFPKPDFGLIADPDKLLSEQSLQEIADRIDEITDKVEVPVQIAVAVASKMHLPNNFYQDDQDNGNNPDEEAAAEEFARGLHDRWGVGIDGESGGTGVLIFLSVDDRVMYISRGSSFDTLLRNSRIDSIIKDLRPSMRQAKYGEGLVLAVELIGTYIQKGEPKWDELVWDYLRIEYFLLSGYALAILGSMRAARRRREAQRVYAEAASQLTAIDRAQAEALQGQFNATSCPICLEDFASDTTGSDDRPIKLLRCGHVFDASCWEEWVNSGQGQVSKCPICKKDVGESSVAAGEQPPQAEAMAPLDDTDVRQHEHLHHEHHRHRHHHRQHNRAMQLFQQDRNFRLTRLAMRYPNVVSQQQVQRWSSPTYNGQLAQDRSFVESRPRAPVVQSARHSDRMGGSSASFGGGTSSGGRGGRF
ncbi:unnamed protein product [Cylindrotheca closterium]|uniref:RING-type domain-containing protein n=1 Tax=Cylindrotheca closterium TaxID=2856 RepID=A0AAD2FIL0_9STRA|nr:unnamed protein product [Cylindrotheca closterium]